MEEEDEEDEGRVGAQAKQFGAWPQRSNDAYNISSGLLSFYHLQLS